jgi:flagellar biosynthesis/type III secretory pathway protein FliH
MISSSDDKRKHEGVSGNAGVVETWALDELTPLRRGEPNDFAARTATVDSRIEAAFEQGREAGRNEGEAAMLLALQTSIEALGAARAQVADSATRWLGNVQENIAALAVAIARHLTDREYAADAQIVAELVRKAIAEFPPDVELTVRLNPDDCSAVLALGANSLQNGASARHQLQLVADRNILPGGCMVDGPDRIIDGRVDMALERVYRRLISADA